MKILGVGLGARASRAQLTECKILGAGRPRSQARIFIAETQRGKPQPKSAVGSRQ
ncbi:MAG: hypothetical protein ACR2L2_03770 [Acidobacteriota bacterium]